jgi:DNA-binding protein YbaB
MREALAKAQEKQSAMMNQLAGGLPIPPGLFG